MILPTNHPMLSESITTLLSDWPIDVCTALKLLHVNLELHQYICCPTCFMLYGPFPEQSDDYHNVPNVCNHCAMPTSAPCSSQLFHEDCEGEVPVPSRRFWHQPFQSWLAHFLLRPDVVKSLCTSVAPSSEETLFDIWDGYFFQEFKGPDDELFLTSDPSKPQFRLVFSNILWLCHHRMTGLPLI